MAAYGLVVDLIKSYLFILSTKKRRRRKAHSLTACSSSPFTLPQQTKITIFGIRHPA